MRISAVGQSILIFIFSLWGISAYAELSKYDAFELLKKNGYRWQQTSLLNEDAEAKKNEALGMLAPHLGFYSREYLGKVNQLQYGFTDPGTLNWFVVGTTGFEFSYGIYDGPAKARLKAAKTNQLLNQANTAEFRNDLTYLMLLQFINVQRIKKSMEVINANLERDNQILAAAHLKQKMGAGVSLDVARSEGLVEREKFRQLDAKTSYFKAQRELANTLGKQELNSDLEPLSFKEIEINPPEAKTKLYSRPDILASQLMADVAEDFKLEAKNEGRLKVNLFGDIGTFGPQFAGLVNSPTGTLGVQVTIPILTGGLLEARVQEMNVKVETAHLQQKQLELESETQLEVALSQINDARAAVAVTQRQIEIANRELEISTKKMKSGAAGSLDVSNAQVNVAGAFDLNVQAIFSFELAKVNYFRAIGDFEKYFSAERRQ